MAKVESKTKIDIEIKVVGKDGKTKGHFSLTSGNLYYTRANAKTVTAQYTYQQLIELIESDLESEE